MKFALPSVLVAAMFAEEEEAPAADEPPVVEVPAPVGQVRQSRLPASNEWPNAVHTLTCGGVLCVALAIHR